MCVNGWRCGDRGTVAVVTITKFSDGAWITALLIPIIMFSMYSIPPLRTVTRNCDPAPLTLDPCIPHRSGAMLSLNKVVEGCNFALNFFRRKCARGMHRRQRGVLRQWNEVVLDR